MGRAKFDVDTIFNTCCFHCKYYGGNYGTHGASFCMRSGNNVVWNDFCNDFEDTVTRENLLYMIRRSIGKES